MDQRINRRYSLEFHPVFDFKGPHRFPDYVTVYIIAAGLRMMIVRRITARHLHPIVEMDTVLNMGLKARSNLDYSYVRNLKRFVPWKIREESPVGRDFVCWCDENDPIAAETS